MKNGGFSRNSVNKIALINIISNLLLQGIAFFTTPIFTRILGTEQYGLYSVFNSWITIMTCILGFGTGSTIGTGMYEFKKDYYRFRSGVLLFGTILSIGAIFLILLFSPVLAESLGYSIDLLSILLLTAFAHYVVSFFQNACIYEREAMKNLIVSVSLSLSTVILSICFISIGIFDEKYLGRVYGTAFPYIFIAILVWIKLFFRAKTGLRKQYCMFAITVGFPVVFHLLAQNILGQSDRVMMQMMEISNSEIGIYSLFYTLTMVLNTVLSTLNTSWCSFYYEDLDAQRWDKLDKKSKNYIELFTVLTMGFLLLSREVSYVMADNSYWGGISVIPALVFAVYFTFMYQFPVNFEFFHKKTDIVAIGTLSSALLNIVLNMLMIPLWGMYGAAIATAISYGCLFVMHYIIVTHMKGFRFHLNARIFLPGLTCVCICTILFYVLAEYWIVRWGLGVILGLFEIHRIYKRRTIF